MKKTIENSSPNGEVSRLIRNGGINKAKNNQGAKRRNPIYNLSYLTPYRKKLRKALTPAEATLWLILKRKKLAGRRFRRQFSVANYILDFYCPQEKLAIELDGQYHFEEAQMEKDRKRDLHLKELGIKVIRIENKNVFNNQEAVIEAITSEFGWDK